MRDSSTNNVLQERGPIDPPICVTPFPPLSRLSVVEQQHGRGSRDCVAGNHNDGRHYNDGRHNDSRHYNDGRHPSSSVRIGPVRAMIADQEMQAFLDSINSEYPNNATD